MGNLWDRLENETAKAYAAFAVYRDLGPLRSLVRARDKLGKRPGYETLLGRWSRRYNWVERAQAWDAHLDEITKTTTEETRKEMARRHIESAINIQKFGQALHGIAADQLNRWKVMIEKGETLDLSPYELARILDHALKAQVDGATLERLTRGEPTARIDIPRRYVCVMDDEDDDET